MLGVRLIDKLYNCNIQVQGLGQAHAGSLVGGSVSVSLYEPRLVDSVFFYIISFTHLALIILLPLLLQDSPAPPNI